MGRSRIYKMPEMLKQFRSDMQLSQREFAEICTRIRGAKVQPHQICHWENGRGINPSSVAMLEQVVADVLRCRVSKKPAA